VAFDGSRALVGAVAFDALSFDADTWLGAAWVLRRTGSGGSAAWVVEDRLIPDEPEEELRGDRYSASVAIDGPWVAIGAYADSPAGSVHVFRRESGGTWTPNQKLVNTLPINIGYGWSLAVRDGVLLTGDPGGEGASVWSYGAAGWTEGVVLQPSDGGAFTRLNFAWSIAYDGERAVVGGPESDPAGAAYVYGSSSLPVAVEPPALPATSTLSALEPNPFHERTVLHLSLLRPQRVEAALYDGLGRRVRLLRAGPLGAGTHVLVIEGAALAPGLYVVRVTGEDLALTQRLVCVR
jgi:hypothetical protein